MLKVWRRISYNGKLVNAPKSPAGVAYVPGLYKLRDVHDAHSDKIEKRAFAEFIENKSEAILSKLINGSLQELSRDEMEHWALYINSSLFRLPHVLRDLDSAATRCVTESLIQAQQEYEQLKGNAPERTLEEWILRHCPEQLSNLGLEAMVGVLGHDSLLARLLQLYWILVDVSDAENPLLLGDCPLLRVNSLFEGNSLLALPLCPSKLFIAVGDEHGVGRVVATPKGELVRQTNVQTLRTAKERVFGDADAEFINKYFLAGV